MPAWEAEARASVHGPEYVDRCPQRVAALCAVCKRTATALAAAFAAGQQAERARVTELETALRTIEQWADFPEIWEDGKQISYGWMHGSNGERDYMRGIARAALRATGGGSP